MVATGHFSTQRMGQTWLMTIRHFPIDRKRQKPLAATKCFAPTEKDEMFNHLQAFLDPSKTMEMPSNSSFNSLKNIGTL
jgi:hypothetical protein